MTTTISAAGRRYRPGRTLAVIITCQFMLLIDGTVVTVALPAIRTALDFSPSALAWTFDAYGLAFGGLLLLGGRLGDLVGRRRLLIGGIAVFTVASLAGGLAVDGPMLLVARAAQGLGAAAAAPSALALIVTNFDGPARVRAIALNSAVAGAGGSLGLLLGGALTAWVSWRAVLFVNVPIGIALIIAAPLVIAEAPRHHRRLDVPGAALGTAGTTALAYGLLRAADAGWGDAGTIAGLAAAVPLLVAFVLVERGAEQPLLPLWLFTDRNRAAGYATMFLLPATMFGVFFLLSQYFGTVLGYGALRTGAAFLPMTVLSFVFARYSARLIGRLGARPLVAGGAVLFLVGLVWLTRIRAGGGYWTELFGPMLLLGIAIGASFVPTSATILSTVRPTESGAASGALQAMQQTGASIGLAVLVTVFGAASHHATAPADLVSGMTAAFAAGTAFVIVVLALALAVLRTRPVAASRG